MANLVVLSLAVLIACTFASPVSNFSNGMHFVVGGQNAVEGQFPHQVSIQLDSSRFHNCGGSIIHKNWVLTACHCILNLDVNFYTVAAGSLKYREAIPYKVEKIILHTGYQNFQNDIALLKIAGDGFDLSNPNKIAVIKLLKEEIPIGAYVTISGWGQDSNEQVPDHLQYTNKMSRGEEKKCRDAHGSTFFEGILCLDHPIGTGVCFGDSGGPATYNRYLAGVASFCMGGCGSKFPDGYTKVSHFRKWINDNTGEQIS